MTLTNDTTNTESLALEALLLAREIGERQGRLDELKAQLREEAIASLERDEGKRAGMWAPLLPAPYANGVVVTVPAPVLTLPTPAPSPTFLRDTLGEEVYRRYFVETVTVSPAKDFREHVVQEADPALRDRLLSLVEVTNPTARVSYDQLIPDPAVLRQVCGGLAAGGVPDFVEIPSCKRGLPVSIRLTVIAAGADPGADRDAWCREHADDCEIAIKDLVLLLPEKMGLRNANPVLGAVTSYDQPLPSETSSEPLCGDTSRRASDDTDKKHFEARRAILDLDASTITDSAEYVTPDGSGDTETEPGFEHLQISWFSTFGDLSDNTFYAEGITTDVELLRNELEFQPYAEANDQDLPTGDVRVFLVLRDGRGGTDFAERRLRIPWITSESQAISDSNRCFDVRKLSP